MGLGAGRWRTFIFANRYCAVPGDMSLEICNVADSPLQDRADRLGSFVASSDVSVSKAAQVDVSLAKGRQVRFPLCKADVLRSWDPSARAHYRCTYWKFRALTLSVSIWRSGVNISRGRTAGA